MRIALLYFWSFHSCWSQIMILQKTYIIWSNDVQKYKLFSYAAYLHRWLSATIPFNRYNLCFYKYTECGDKCNVLYFTALHIRVVPPSFSHFEECPLSDSTCWLIGYFRMDVTERLLNTKVVVFLGFLWFAVEFLLVKYNEIFDSLEKV